LTKIYKTFTLEKGKMAIVSEKLNIILKTKEKLRKMLIDKNREA